ncbi:MAG: FecR domain-containing protein [Pseudomonadota bacterium]
MITNDEHYEELSRIAHDWRERMSRADATEAERKELNAWLKEDVRHEEAFDRARTVWAAYDHLRRDDIDADLMPQASPGLLASVIETVVTSVAAAPRIAAATAAAFTIVAASLAFVTLRGDPSAPTLASYKTGIAETMVVTLGDGSVATLGARTQIEAAMSRQARTVTLISGAAFFEVHRDERRPFSVKADALTATALGTEFDVRSSGGVHRVAVAEGRVEVVYPHVLYGGPTAMKTRKTLEPGDEVAATQAEGMLGIQRVDTAEVAAWRDKKLIYAGGTLGELVADANRYSERQIVLDASAKAYVDRKLTASFDADNIDRMLVMLTRSYPIEIDDSEPGVRRLRARGDARP